MKKVLILFMFGLCLQSCKTVKLECSNEEPVYRVEDKKFYNDNYYIKLSRLDNPIVLETKQFGKATYKALHGGDKLDKNYRLTK